MGCLGHCPPLSVTNNLNYALQGKVKKLSFQQEAGPGKSRDPRPVLTFVGVLGDCDLVRGINQSRVEKATNSRGQEGEGGREKVP